jgi:hypothetical protein
VKRALLLLLAACASRQAPPAAEPRLVADESGVREIAADGAARVLSKTSAMHGHRLPGGDVVFLHADEPSAPLELRRVTRAGEERTLGRVDPVVMCGTEVDYLLAVKRVSLADGALCVEMSDGEVRQVHRMDVATGSIESALLAAPQGCGKIVAEPPCR